MKLRPRMAEAAELGQGRSSAEPVVLAAAALLALVVAVAPASPQANCTSQTSFGSRRRLGLDE